MNVLTAAQQRISWTFDTFNKIYLSFSGGKDSIACLHLVKDYLDKVVVVWVNTGANFPEIEQMMREVKSIVTHFHEIKND